MIERAYTLRTDYAAGEVAAIASAQGLELVLLRGAAIARRLYDEGERRYSDIDLLVAEPNRVRVEEILRGLAYSPYTPPDRAQHWRRVSDGCVVDLHVTLWGVEGAPDSLWRWMDAHRETLALGTRSIAVPDLAGTALVIALHASQHGSLVPHAKSDLARALVRFDRDVWRQAAAGARATGSLTAFRQGLTMLRAGRAMLLELELEPARSRRSALRQDGVELPSYLLESLPMRERFALIRSRIVPSRAEMAVFVEPRAAASTAWLLAAHARRLARLPGRMLRFVAALRRA
jgi:hypothetical protein